MSFRIRPARIEDAAAIIAMLNPIIEAGGLTIMDQPLTLHDQVAFMRAFPDDGVFHVAVAEDDRTILGLQSIDPRDATAIGEQEISTFIALEAHRRGIGRGLSNATLAAAKAKGVRRVIAHVRTDNPPAIAFYQSIGFAPIGTALHQPLDGSPPARQIVMDRHMT